MKKKMTKAELRQLVKRNLAELTDVPERSRLVRQNLLPLLKPDAGLMTYVPFGNEVIPLDLNTVFDFLPSLRFLCVPLIQENEIVPIRINSLDDLAPGTFGIGEPKPALCQLLDRQVVLDDIDLVFVPGLAFDRQGHRLGRGKGYYDRFLKRLKPAAKKIGVAFDCQVFDKIPLDSWDVVLDGLVTENGFS